MVVGCLHPVRSARSFKHAWRGLWLSLGLALLADNANATVYQYTGTAFDSITNYTPPCATGLCFSILAGQRVTAHIVTAAPLAPNLVNADIRAQVTSYIASNGSVATNSVNATSRLNVMRVDTNATGQITAASVHFLDWGNPAPHVAGNRFYTWNASMGSLSATSVNAGCNSVGTGPDGTPDVCTAYFIDASTTEAQASGGGTWLRVPEVTINSVSLAEGNAGTSNMIFTVSLSEAPTAPVSLDWATNDLSATAGSDYVAASGTLTWAAGDGAPKTITVQINGDVTPEPDERLAIVFSNLSNVVMSGSAGAGTIVNDDAVAPPPPPATPTPVPTLDSWALLMLAATLFGLSAASRRRRG